MSSYSIKFTKSAHKEFGHLSASLQEKIVEALHMLAINPFSNLLQIKKLKGSSALFRLRIGDYRVVYEVKNQELILLIIKIGHRKEVYRGF